MAKAKKLPSGNWRVRVYDYTDEYGKRHYKSFTSEYKADAEYEAKKYQKERPSEKPKTEMTVGEAIDRYIDLCTTLSPTTVARYRKMRIHGFPHLMDSCVDNLDDISMQTAINIETRRPKERTGETLSPKTVKNEYGLISSALKTICGKTFNVKLPKVQSKPKELPSPEAVISLLKGSSIELPCLLAMWLSFSMSEIRGFRCSSIRGGYIYVDQVIVDVDGLATEKKDAKVDSRNRRQAIPKYIMDLIEQQESWINYTATGEDGPLIPLTQRQIYKPFVQLMEKNGLDMTFHDLRHMFASVMLTKLNIPEKVVQDEGGWSTPHVMKKVYSNTFSDSRKLADEKRDEYFEGLL